MLSRMIFVLFILKEWSNVSCDEVYRARGGDDDSGCVTADGRAGTCTRVGSCVTVKDDNSLPVCYTVPVFGTKYVCCPSTSQPGVYARSMKGENDFS